MEQRTVQARQPVDLRLTLGPLQHVVSFALADEARGTDERMLELLAPWQGQRGRVCRLLLNAGPRPPRFGPRSRLRQIARH